MFMTCTNVDEVLFDVLLSLCGGSGRLNIIETGECYVIEYPQTSLLHMRAHSETRGQQDGESKSFNPLS